MTIRRWFSGADLNEWKMLSATGYTSAPFFLYPFRSVRGWNEAVQALELKRRLLGVYFDDVEYWRHVA